MTLEEVINYCKPFGYDDKVIIEYYIIENNLESEYIDLITKLSKSKIDKLDAELRNHHWLAFSNADLYDKCYKKKLNPKIAVLLDEAQRGFILGCDLSKTAEELKGLVVDMDEPTVYYQPAMAELMRLGVRFKDTTDVDIENKIRMFGGNANGTQIRD